MTHRDRGQSHELTVRIPVADVHLVGDLRMPAGGEGIVLFAHGSGSSRLSPRNRYVAQVLNEAGLSTLLIDLLTGDEERVDMRTRHLRFDIGLLAERLVRVIDWLEMNSATGHLPIGCFGASTGAAAALVAAAERPEHVRAVVSRGGRPDLAGDKLAMVRAPTLLIVGGNDQPVIELNRDAMRHLTGVTRLEVVPGATHLFEEPGTLARVSALASDWFVRYLSPPATGHADDKEAHEQP